MFNTRKTIVQRVDGRVYLPGFNYDTRNAVILQEDANTIVVKLPARSAVHGAPGMGQTYMEPALIVFEKTSKWMQRADRGSRGERSINVREIAYIKIGKGWSSQFVPHPDAIPVTPNGNPIRKVKEMS